MKSLFIGQLFNEKIALIFEQAKANPPIREGGAALAAENEFICASERVDFMNSLILSMLLLLGSHFFPCCFSHIFITSLWGSSFVSRTCAFIEKSGTQTSFFSLYISRIAVLTMYSAVKSLLK